MLLFNIFELRLCLTRYQVKNHIKTIRFPGLFVRVNQALVCIYLITPTQSTFLGVLFASILSGYPTTTGIDCLVRMGNKRKESFPSIQRRMITSSRIEPQSATFPNAQPLPLATAFFRSKHIMTVFL